MKISRRLFVIFFLRRYLRLNLQDKKVILQPEVSGFKRPVKAHKTSLVLVPGKENTPFAPNEVQPVETEVGLDLNQPFELEAASMVVYRF